MRENFLRRIAREFPEIQNILDVQFFTDTLCNEIMVHGKNLENTCPNCAITHNCNIDHSGFLIISI